MKVFVGYDVRDDLAFRACVSSLRKHASIDLDIFPLKDHELRRMGIYWRDYHVEPSGQMVDSRDGRPFSTQFSFSRFAVPLLAPKDEWVLFCDADMLFRRDIAELLALADDSKAIMCVKHEHAPSEAVKMDGVSQVKYRRKNWSSQMLMKPGRCTMTRYILNNQSGLFLHAMLWQDEETIGALPEEWNWLESWSSPDIDAAAAHFTRGDPSMLGDDLPYAQEWWDAVRAWQPDMNRNGLQ